jgi:DNA polymerase III delta prime subunit
MTLKSLYESGRLPHAVLLLREDCEQSVQQALQLYGCNEADTVYVKELMPDKSYKIGALREIVSSGNLRPQFGDVRMFVFHEFDTMSEVCQNALLKFIEEPYEFNRFIMTASSASKILPTILSRVVMISSFEATQSPNNHDCEIADTIITALKSKNEYDTAAAFSKIKDRHKLSEVLQALVYELSVIMKTAKKPEKIIKATDVLQKYIKRMEVNPNIPMTTSSCAAEIYTVLHK